MTLEARLTAVCGTRNDAVAEITRISVQPLDDMMDEFDVVVGELLGKVSARRSGSGFAVLAIPSMPRHWP